ncbi:MAG: radical SAM protein [Bryobacteraceae bacterium]|nr:radical SAM protein [Bryobacteraceae bacterium]
MTTSTRPLTTRLAIPLIPRIRRLNAVAHLCCYGLYAPLNAEFLKSLGVRTIIGGEFEAGLVQLASGEGSQADSFSMDRLQFRVPDRSLLPVLGRYARLRVGTTSKRVGQTEASRGCKHLCRHCPVVPVYQGVFRIVQHEVVLEDIRRQVQAGAEHISFGDPDFFNGPGHARRIVEQLHSEYPDVTYDVTIKVEHLLQQRSLLPVLKSTGCLFVTSAVESLQDDVLLKLQKGHTRADFIQVVRMFRELGLTLAPTFIPFTPWTTEESFRELLRTLRELDLVEQVSPVQLALRLLIPAGSLLLELPEIARLAGPFEQAGLLHRWQHPDRQVDALAVKVLAAVSEGQKQGRPRAVTFGKIWEIAHGTAPVENFNLVPRAAIPYLDEPWYC